jgi:hypothetical protein
MSIIRKIFFLSLILLLVQCRKRNIANWDADIVFPLVNSQLNIKNFLGDSIFNADNSGLLSLSLTRTLTAIKLDSLVKLPDTTIIKSFVTVFPLSLTPGQSFNTLPATELKFDIGNGVALKKIEIKSGLLSVKFSNTTLQPLDLVYSIASAFKYNQPFVISETIPPGTNSLIKSYSLDGYTLNMQGLLGNVYNTIVQNYTVSLNANAAATIIPFGQGAFIEITYSNIIPQYIEGYFGQQTVALALDTVNFGILKDFEAKNFMLNSATINFDIINQLGAEFTASLNTIKGINSSTVIPLNAAQLANININRASKSGVTISQSVKSVSLNSSNSNIVPLLSMLPNKLSYQGNIALNPFGNLSGFNDFAFYNKGLNVIANINLPLRFNADYFKLASTTPIDFTNIKQLERVNFGDFILAGSNGFPFNAQVQAYMIDENNQIIDSLFIPKANTLLKGATDAQNIVTVPTLTKVKASFDKNKIHNLKKTKSLKIITYFFMPPNPPDIKLLENYSIDINIIAELNYNVKAA